MYDRMKEKFNSKMFSSYVSHVLSLGQSLGFFPRLVKKVANKIDPKTKLPKTLFEPRQNSRTFLSEQNAFIFY